MSRAGSRSQSEPATQSLAEALTALCAEVGIPFEEMLHTVESALAVAYTRAFNAPGMVTVRLDTKTGALDVRSRVIKQDGTVIDQELPIGQAETAFTDDGELLDPEQRGALTQLVDILAARAGAQQAQAA